MQRIHNIQIKEIDAQNVFDICELTTNQNGIGTTMEEYLCCNATSIAESKYYPEMCPRAIYRDEVPVGFVMYKYTAAEPKTVTICRFMIDWKFKHRGLGRAALAAILQYLKDGGTERVVLMIDEDNSVAKQLYLSLGFTFTGKVEKEEYYYALTL